MRILQRITSTTAYLAMTATTMLSVPAMGHDPLNDEHSNHDRSHYNHYDSYLSSAVTSEVRTRINLFREAGDDSHLDEAWEMLEPALQTELPNPQTLILAAFVAQSRHEFDNAETYVNQSIAMNNANDEAWLLLASIHLVRGDTESASVACRQMRNVPVLVLLTCNGRIALASGDHEVAFEQLRSVLGLAESQRLPPELLAWSYSVTGDLATASGSKSQARKFYLRSLALVERTQVRAALVDVLLIEEKYEEARHTLEHGSSALPLLVRRLIAAKHLGRSDEFRNELHKVQREFERWISEEDWMHAREMARFFIDVVDRPELARRLALINIDLQKEPEDYRLVMRSMPPTITG